MDEDVQDEELPQPDRHRTRRDLMRRNLGLAALALVGVALVVNVVAGQGDRRGAPESSDPAEAASGIPEFVTAAPLHPEYLPRTPTEAVRCPSGVECVRLPYVPEPVKAALRDVFPGAIITDASTVRLYVRNYGSALRSFQVDAQAGTRHIVLQLRGAAQSDTQTSESIRIGGQAITRYETYLIQYHVTVVVVAPAGDPAPVEALKRLATDLRLLRPY